MTDARADEQMNEVFAETAKQLAAQVANVLHEPPLPFKETTLAHFPWLNTRWYSATQTSLEALGFTCLCDVDGTPLKAQHAKASILRMLVSQDGRVAAGLYEIVPQRSGLLVWLLLKMLWRWPKPKRVVEFLSYSDTHAISTLNTESLFAAAPSNKRTVVSERLKLTEMLDVHMASARAHGSPLLVQRAASDWMLARERERQRQNAWRSEVGLLPEESEVLLAQCGRWAERIRPFFLQEIAQMRTVVQAVKA